MAADSDIVGRLREAEAVLARVRALAEECESCALAAEELYEVRATRIVRLDRLRAALDGPQ